MCDALAKLSKDIEEVKQHLLHTTDGPIGAYVIIDRAIKAARTEDRRAYQPRVVNGVIQDPVAEALHDALIEAYGAVE